jgi:hypothetical protein
MIGAETNLEAQRPGMAIAEVDARTKHCNLARSISGLGV